MRKLIGILSLVVTISVVTTSCSKSGCPMHIGDNLQEQKTIWNDAVALQQNETDCNF